MSIKLRIILIFTVFVSSIVVLGITTIYLNRQQAEYFTNARSYVQFRENLGESKRVFVEKVQALDYYVYLSQKSEIHNFRDKRRELTDMLDKMNEFGLFAGFLAELRTLLGEFELSAGEVVDLAETGRRVDAVRLADEVLPGKLEGIRAFLSEGILLVDERVRVSHNTAVSFQMRLATFFIIFFFLVLVFVSIMGYSLYRAVVTPLKKLEQATDAVGKGNLDHRLKLKTKSEFRKISDSFNRMIQDLKEYQLKITQMGKMAAVGELSGGVAHEINNPLTGILGHSQLILQKIPEENPLYQTVKKMERAALRCRAIVSGLLDFSRKEKFDFKVHDLRDIINETLILCQTEAVSKGIKITKQYVSKDLRVTASARNLQQVFLNIIQNSMQAMPDGGRITIKVSRTKRENRDYLLTEFTDTGTGLTEEAASRAFEPFYTTKDIGQGTGLGLSISYRIMKNHNGLIEISSSGTGRGATVSVYIPSNLINQI